MTVIRLTIITLKMAQIVRLVCLLIFSTLWTNRAFGDVYYIGTGRYDITGPAVETEMVSV